jgi:hypothetical protein
MEQPGRCDHCGGEIYGQGDDQWWTCAECGCAWSMAGELIRRGPECPARGTIEPDHLPGHPAVERSLKQL